MNRTKLIPQITESMQIIEAAGWKLFHQDGSVLLNELTGEYNSLWYATHSLTGAVFMFETDDGTEDMVLDSNWAAFSCLTHLANSHPTVKES